MVSRGSLVTLLQDSILLGGTRNRLESVSLIKVLEWNTMHSQDMLGIETNIVISGSSTFSFNVYTHPEIRFLVAKYPFAYHVFTA